MGKKNKGKKKMKITGMGIKLCIIAFIGVGFLVSTFINNKEDEPNKVVNTTTNGEEKTSEEIYKEKSKEYSEFFNNTEISLYNKTINATILDNASELAAETKMEITTNTDNDQAFYKVTCQGNAVATIFDKEDVYIGLLNANSKLLTPIRLYHSRTGNAEIKTKIYNQYINLETLNRQFAQSISFSYQGSEMIDDIACDKIQLTVPKEENIQTNGNSTTIASNYGNDVITIGEKNQNNSNSTIEKLILYIDSETHNIIQIIKVSNGKTTTMKITNTNAISFNAQGKIAEIPESEISLTIASEMNYMKDETKIIK